LYWGQSSWAAGGNLGKIHQFIILYYFSADLQNDLKSFDTAIDQSIAEVLQGGLRRNIREGHFAIVWRRDKKYKINHTVQRGMERIQRRTVRLGMRKEGRVHRCGIRHFANGILVLVNVILFVV
jgi:hypothetical protein